MGKRRRKGDSEREKRARARQQPTPGRTPVLTEAAARLATALDEAGLPELAARARRLDFDENYSRADLPLRDLMVELVRAGDCAAGLRERLKAGDFDATPADEAAWAATPRGRAEREQTERDFAALPPELRAKMDAVMSELGSRPDVQAAVMDEAEAKIEAELKAGADAPDGPPDDDMSTGTWVHSDLAPDGRTYLLTVTFEGKPFALPPDRALRYAAAVARVAMTAAHESAVIRQIRSLGMEPDVQAQAVKDMRADRPEPDPAATYPLGFEPIVSARDLSGQIYVSYNGVRACQWDVPQALRHARWVMEIAAGVDLDAGYFRFLTVTCDVPAATARQVVGALREFVEHPE